MRLSFKRQEKERGLAGIGHPHPMVDIKVDKKKVGFIYGPSWSSKDDMWHVQIAITKKDVMEDGNPNCPWRYVTLRPKFFSELDARNYLKTHKEDIFKLNLHYFDD